MTSLTLYDLLWFILAFVVIILWGYFLREDTKEVRREDREADDFQEAINEMKHKDNP